MFFGFVFLRPGDTGRADRSPSPGREWLLVAAVLITRKGAESPGRGSCRVGVICALVFFSR